MAKNPQLGEDIHIAPGITGKRNGNGELVITVDSTQKRLYPDKHIEDKIYIFEKQVKGWFLDRASKLGEQEDDGFVILMIATAYIEEIEQYRTGQSSEGNSCSFFTDGIKRIFDIDSRYDERISNLYKELRCGLFHNGMTGPYIRIHSTIYKKPIDFTDGIIIKINQKLFLEKVKEDFEEYLIELRGTEHSELINNFNSMYKFE